MARCAMVVVMLAVLGAGCRDPEAERSALAEEVVTLSRDQCLASTLSETQRSQLRRSAREGRISREDVDRYILEVRKRAGHAHQSGMSQERFCPIQLDVWRRHFGG